MGHLSESRRRMIIAMGSRCADCGQVLDPSLLIIHHPAFERGQPLGYQHPSRWEAVYEWERTGRIPKGVELLCDRCNRKRHGYRASMQDIFGKREI